MNVLGWIMKSKLKVSGGILGCGGALTLILGLYSSGITEVEKAEARSKEHIELKLVPFRTEITNLKIKVNDTNKKVNEMYKYLLNKK